MTRFRIGHIGLNEYLNRFHILDRPDCEQMTCIGLQIRETIEHYLLSCPAYSSQREILKATLARNAIIQFDVKTLLLGGEDCSKHHIIMRALYRYIVSTGRAEGFF